MKCKTLTKQSCSRESQISNKPIESLGQLVEDYKKKYLELRMCEKEWFSNAENLREAINKAVLSELNNEQTLLASHQRRIGRQNLIGAKDSFVAQEKKYYVAENFDEVFEITRNVITPVGTRIGPLARYDFSYRISAYLKFDAEYIYLHAGTKEGLYNLGFTRSKKICPNVVKQKYEDFQSLSAEDLENLLCIYKNELRNFCIS